MKVRGDIHVAALQTSCNSVPLINAADAATAPMECPQLAQATASRQVGNRV